MNSSGVETKAQIDRLISQQQRTADSMAGNLQQSQKALDTSAASMTRELRPYVSVSDMQVIGVVENGKSFSGVAKIINSGRTPAIGVQVCGDVVITTSSIADDYPCPSPTSPKRVPETEASVTVIGSGLGGQVNSPGTTADVQPIGLLPLLTAHQFRLYFYGYITYKDTIRSNTIHRTTFCGMYGVQSKAWNACEKHNHMD
jgi:hypothetical protein